MDIRLLVLTRGKAVGAVAMKLREGNFEAEIDRSPRGDALLYRYRVYKVSSGPELLFSGYALELQEAAATAQAHLEKLNRKRHCPAA